MGICCFDELDEYSVLEIFSFLGIKELSRCERVSTKWRYLAQRSWSTIKVLRIQDHFGSFNQPLISTIILKSILQKTLNLEELDMRHLQCHKLSNNFIQIIVDHSSKLTKLLISCSPVLNRDLKLLSDHCTSLRVLSLEKCHRVTDDGLRFILRKCKNLETLILALNPKLTGRCFLQGSKTLKELNMNECSCLEESGVIRLQLGCPNLERLSLDGILFGETCFTFLCESFQNLQSLSLNRAKFFFPTHSSLSSLIHLKYLYLCDCWAVDSELLQIISEKCLLLEYIELSGCKKYCINKGLKCFQNLKYLQYVDLSKCCYLDQNGLHHLSLVEKLKTLILMLCLAVDDKGIECLLNGSSLLSKLDIRGCRKVSMNCFPAIQKHAELVENFTVVASGTKLSAEELPAQKCLNLDLNTLSIREFELDELEFEDRLSEDEDFVPYKPYSLNEIEV